MGICSLLDMYERDSCSSGGASLLKGIGNCRLAARSLVLELTRAYLQAYHRSFRLPWFRSTCGIQEEPGGTRQPYVHEVHQTECKDTLSAVILFHSAL